MCFVRVVGVGVCRARLCERPVGAAALAREMCAGHSASGMIIFDKKCVNVPCVTLPEPANGIGNRRRVSENPFCVRRTGGCESNGAERGSWYTRAPDRSETEFQ